MADGEYSNKSDFSKAEVVKQQVLRCNEIRSREMKEGYFNYTAEGQKIYVADSRKQWVSAVKALRRMLEPEARKNEEFIEKEKQIKEREKKIFDSYSYTPMEQNIVNEGEEQRKEWHTLSGAVPYIPERDALITVEEKGKAVSKPGVWNKYVNMYWNSIVEIYDELFAALNVLIDECNYFKQKVSYGFDLDELSEEEDDK